MHILSLKNIVISVLCIAATRSFALSPRGGEESSVSEYWLFIALPLILISFFYRIDWPNFYQRFSGPLALETQEEGELFEQGLYHFASLGEEAREGIKKLEKHRILISAGFPIWEINLFSQHLVTPAVTQFVLAKNSVEIENLLAPIVKKAFLKYRSKIDKKSFHQLFPYRSDMRFLSYLKDEYDIQVVLFDFLDNVVTLAATVGEKPVLVAYIQEEVFLRVTWEIPYGFAKIESFFKDKGFPIAFKIEENKAQLILHIARQCHEKFYHLSQDDPLPEEESLFSAAELMRTAS